MLTIFVNIFLLVLGIANCIKYFFSDTSVDLMISGLIFIIFLLIRTFPLREKKKNFFWQVLVIIMYGLPALIPVMVLRIFATLYALVTLYYLNGNSLKGKTKVSYYDFLNEYENTKVSYYDFLNEYENNENPNFNDVKSNSYREYSKEEFTPSELEEIYKKKRQFRYGEAEELMKQFRIKHRKQKSMREYWKSKYEE